MVAVILSGESYASSRSEGPWSGSGPGGGCGRMLPVYLPWFVVVGALAAVVGGGEAGLGRLVCAHWNAVAVAAVVEADADAASQRDAVKSGHVAH